jgi:hypothetical protein
LDPPHRSTLASTAGTAAETLKRTVMRTVSAALPKGRKL